MSKPRSSFFNNHNNLNTDIQGPTAAIPSESDLVTLSLQTLNRKGLFLSNIQKICHPGSELYNQKIIDLSETEGFLDNGHLNQFADFASDIKFKEVSLIKVLWEFIRQEPNRNRLSNDSPRSFATTRTNPKPPSLKSALMSPTPARHTPTNSSFEDSFTSPYLVRPKPTSLITTPILPERAHKYNEHLPKVVPISSTRTNQKYNDLTGNSSGQHPEYFSSAFVPTNMPYSINNHIDPYNPFNDQMTGQNSANQVNSSTSNDLEGDNFWDDLSFLDDDYIPAPVSNSNDGTLIASSSNTLPIDTAQDQVSNPILPILNSSSEESKAKSEHLRKRKAQHQPSESQPCKPLPCRIYKSTGQTTAQLQAAQASQVNSQNNSYEK